MEAVLRLVKDQGGWTVDHLSLDLLTTMDRHIVEDARTRSCQRQQLLVELLGRAGPPAL